MNSTVTLSVPTYTIWQIVVFLVLLFRYHDDDQKSDQSFLVINNT